MRKDFPLAGAGQRLTTGATAGNARDAVPDPGRFRWDAYYAVILASVLAVLATARIGTADRAAGLAAAAAMAPWYVFVGRPVMHVDDYTEDSRRGLVYLAGAIAAFAVAVRQDPTCWFLAAALCPQCFMVARSRRAMAAVITLNIMAAGLTISRSPDLSGTMAALAIATFGIGFSMAYTGWVRRIVDQSTERAALIEQLESTRAELARANREAGMLAERQRLAADIHDTLAQGFTSIVMLIQAAESELADNPAEARRYLQLAARTGRESLAETRAVVAALTPSHLQSGTLDGALGRLADTAGAELGITASFGISGPSRPLPTGTEVMLLRVCQEALSNVRKHARAGEAAVRLTYADGAVRLEVTDDGAGFEPDAVNGGYGLRGMRGRVGEAGGRLTVCSAPGKGTSVTVEVPS